MKRKRIGDMRPGTVFKTETGHVFIRCETMWQGIPVLSCQNFMTWYWCPDGEKEFEIIGRIGPDGQFIAMEKEDDRKP